LTPFETIRVRAEKRKGGAEALAHVLPPKPDPNALRKLRDDRVLAEMTRRVFSAGFAWSVVESKWPGFEQAFALAACGRAGRILARTDHGRPHRSQWREDRLGA